MRERTAQLATCAVLMIFSLPVPLLQAQQAEATLSGKVTDSSGAALPNAKVSVRNVETGQAAEVQTDGTGTYNLPKLAPGDYEVTVSVKGFTVNTGKVTLTAGATLTYNATLTALPSEPQPQSPASAGAGAPPSNNAPSLQDLGFSPAEIKGTSAAGKADAHVENPPTVGTNHNAPDDRVGGHVHQCGWQEHQQYGPNGAHDFGFRNRGPVLYDRILCDPRAARVGDKIPRADSLS